jgi:hypothetical protein
LAVAGEQAAAENADGPGGLARLRDRLGDLPAASPWLPRQLWKRIVIGGIFGLMLTATGFLLVQPLAWAAPLAPVAEQLLSGSRPLLLVFATTTLWFAAGQFAALIGWYRSHSENDFHGRYRVWAVLAAGFAGASFLAGTGVHEPLFAAALPYWRWPIWRPAVMSWLAPLASVGLMLWWRMDRDVRRCLTGLWLMRLATAAMLALGVGHLFAPELAGEAWFSVVMTLGPLIGPGLLVLGLWLQACYVAYVCADPPETPAVTWVGRLWALSKMLWPFGSRTSEEEEAKPARRRKKAEEDDGETAPKRRRKPAAKSRRTTKPRTRVKPDSDAEGEAEETWEEEAASEEESSDWPASEETEAKSAAVTSGAKSVSKPSRADDDGDAEEEYRVDGAHENSDMFKGLSKRQRRELKRQMRDQQHNP